MIPNRILSIVSVITLGLISQGYDLAMCSGQQAFPFPLQLLQIDASAPQAQSNESLRPPVDPYSHPSYEPMTWWNHQAHQCVLTEPNWVSFDITTIMVDALTHNPRIAAVKHRTAVALERVLQEDAAFDANILLDSRYGRTSDPVGNTLTTGGPERLFENSWSNRAGVARTTRDGTRVDLTQEAGLLDSNSLFFQPADQGNAKLSLNMTRPLMAGSGKLYNERLIIQARIESRTSWEELLSEVQTQVADVMKGFWRLYESRCHLLQKRESLQRGEEIAKLIESRADFDSGRLELAKVRSRLARRYDLVIEAEKNVFNHQVLLMQIVGSPVMPPGTAIELIPNGMPYCSPLTIDPRDAILTGVNNRSDIRAAALNLESAALEISISRRDLLPQLDAVVSAYLAGLNGNNAIGTSFIDQFENVPGFSGGLVYERPYGNRVAKSKLRASQQKYLEMSERYREAVSITSAEVAIATRNLNTVSAQAAVKSEVLEATVKQELLVRERWKTMGTDGRYAALVLEDLLEQQEARTVAEAEYVSNHVNYLIGLIDLQKTMGTLLIAEGLEPIRTACINQPVSLRTSTASPVSTESDLESPPQLPRPSRQAR